MVPDKPATLISSYDLPINTEIVNELEKISDFEKVDSDESDMISNQIKESHNVKRNSIVIGEVNQFKPKKLLKPRINKSSTNIFMAIMRENQKNDMKERLDKIDEKDQKSCKDDDECSSNTKQSIESEKEILSYAEIKDSKLINIENPIALPNLNPQTNGLG
jgi:hypothetical protein